jgi:hypothetical protein
MDQLPDSITAWSDHGSWQPELEFFLLPSGPLSVTADRQGLGSATTDGYHANPLRDCHAGFRARVVELWTALKKRESNALELQPHPAEFDLYEDL